MFRVSDLHLWNCAFFKNLTWQLCLPLLYQTISNYNGFKGDGDAPAGESMFPPVSISNVFPICAIWHRFQHFNPENVFILVHKLLQLELLPFLAIRVVVKRTPHLFHHLYENHINEAIFREILHFKKCHNRTPYLLKFGSWYFRTF